MQLLLCPDDNVWGVHGPVIFVASITILHMRNVLHFITFTAYRQYETFKIRNYVRYAKLETFNLQAIISIKKLLTNSKHLKI